MSRQRFVFATLAPAIAILAAIALASTAGAVWFSLMNRTLRSPAYKFVGIYNFERLFRDPRFYNALEISALWEMITVVGALAVATALAVLTVETVKSALWRNVISFAFLAPVLLPRVAAAFIWRFLYSPSLGLVNYLIGLTGAGPVEFLADPHLALYAVAAVDIWQWGLFFAVILMKLLETLPREPLEAAMLDHASRWEIHAFITLPMLRGPIVSLALVKAVESLRSFDLIFVMTGGGPGVSTETLDLYAYQVGVNLGGRISYASAMAILLLIVTNVIFAIVWRRVKTWTV
jgi:multiple sugar transport system permease protein